MLLLIKNNKARTKKYITIPNFNKIRATKIELFPFAKNIDAQRLIYNIYVGDMNWTPSFSNPSGLHIKNIPEGKILTDNYDFHSHAI